MKKTKIFVFLLLPVFISSFNFDVFPQKRKKTAARREVVVRAPKIVNGAAPRVLSPNTQRRLDAFNYAWQTINDNYFDQTFSGLNWEKIRREYEPKVLQATTDAQLHDILQEMINRLNRSHFAIIPPEIFRAIETAKIQALAKKEAREKNAERVEETDEENADESEFDFSDYAAKYGIGVELVLIDDQFVVKSVEPESSAAKAGIKTGFVVDKINNVSLADLLRQIDIHYAKIQNAKRHLPAEIVEYLLDGDEDAAVALSVKGENGQPKELKVARERLKGERVSLGENYPEQFLKFETVALSEQVGYIKFNVFAMPIIEKFCAGLTQLKDKQAIIIDLRGNTGGILGTLVGLSGMLTETSIDLGTSIYKIGSEPFVARSKPKNFKGKIVFLVDGQTASAAEIFAAGLQENNRALIVGEKTAGEALPSVSVELPTGAVLLYPIANYKTRNGNFLEGKGVEPNFAVALDKKSLLEGNDPQLAAALKLIKENSAFPKPLAAAQPESVKAPPEAKSKASTITKTPSAIPPVAFKKDEKALQTITEFIAVIGGEEAHKLVNSYVLQGKMKIAYRGSKVEGEISAFREKPDRYAEILKSDSMGEIRQIYNGKKSFVQTEYEVNREAAANMKIGDYELFAPFEQLLKKDEFKSLNYMGAFDMLGEQAHVIEAVTKENQTVAFAFSVKTKLLISYTQQYFVVLFEDYRPVEKVLLPFSINRGSFMNVSLDQIKLNAPIDESNFKEKLNCYDREN